MRYQKIHSQIWHDEKFITLSQDARLLFFYLMSSPHSNQIGIYIIPKEYICADLKWQPKQLPEPFKELLDKQLILYDESVRLLCIPNHLKYNTLENQNQVKYAMKLISALPASPLFAGLEKLFTKPFHKPLRELLVERYAKPIAIAIAINNNKDILSGKEKTPDFVSEIIDFLNLTTKQNYKPTTPKTKELIAVRVKEGFTLENFKTVITKKYTEWKDNPDMVKYLRPETLFGNKFESYLNQPVTPEPKTEYANISFKTGGSQNDKQ